MPARLTLFRQRPRAVAIRLMSMVIAGLIAGGVGSAQPASAAIEPEPDPFASISGVLTTPEGNRVQAEIQVFMLDPSGTEFVPSAPASSGTDGQYSVPNLLPGTYRLHFVPAEEALIDEFYDDKTSLDTADDIVLLAGDAVTANAVLARKMLQNTSRPEITGTAKVGEVLTASPGTWDPPPGSVSYQWFAAGDAINGADSQTYTVRDADLGKTITVRVTARKDGYTEDQATSAPTAAVVGRGAGCRNNGGCTQTRTEALAPNRVGDGKRAAVCGRVTGPGIGALPLGKLRLEVSREGGGFSVVKSVRFAGGTRCMHTRRLVKKGPYTVTAEYLPLKGSSFAASAGSAAFRVPGGSRSLARKSRGELMVVGDSLARIYNDKAGSARQGFWSMVGHAVKGEPHVVAQGGSGFVKPGLSRCKGRTFLEQLTRPSVRQRFAQADAAIIEGGRNDTQVCTGHGNFAEVSTEQLRNAVDEFMDEAQSLRGADDCTIVVTPWGPKGTKQRARITPVIRRSAERHGFTFVDTVGLLNERTTTEDGVHPTHAGNRALSRAILDKSFAEACFY